MTEFTKLQLSDRELFNKYLGKYSFHTYEYAFSTLYIWREMCKVQYTQLQDYIIVKKEEKERGEYFMAPIGYSPDKLYIVIEELRKLNRNKYKMPFLFRDVEQDFLDKLINMYGKRVIYSEEENNFDYIYDVNDLISLSGKKYHSKKNHFNSFITSYSYTVRDIKEENIGEQCIKLAHSWYENQTIKTDELKHELQAIEDLINNSKELNIEGMAVFVDDVIAGFSLGEKLNDNMAIIHIEKGNNDFRGIYAFINKLFLDKYFKEVKYVNRQEDLGLKGLRKAKMSYHPIKLEKKYNVNIEEV